MIHLAEIFVSTGVVVGVAMQGSVVMEKFQFREAYQDLRNIENAVWAFHEEHGYWPRECQQLFIQGELRKTEADVCYRESEQLVLDIRRLFGDKKTETVWPREFALSQVKKTQGKSKWAIVMKNVDPALAGWLDQEIDGYDSLQTGRIRISTPPGRKAKVDVAYLFESSIH